MMSPNKPLLSSLFFAAAALSFTACSGDDVDPVDVVDCEATPEHEECIVVACEERINDVILEAIDPKSDVVTIVQPEVEQVSEAYRILTFNAGGGQDPNATSRLYLDLDTDTFLELSDADALADTDWDIAFDAVGYIYTNSNQSGPGGLRIATIEGIADEQAFLELEQPPRDSPVTWVQDTFVDEETCDVITNRFIGTDFLQTAIGDWFTYDFGTHSTAPKEVAYLVYNSSDNHHIYKIKFLSYDAHTKVIELGVAEFVAPE